MGCLPSWPASTSGNWNRPNKGDSIRNGSLPASAGARAMVIVPGSFDTSGLKTESRSMSAADCADTDDDATLDRAGDTEKRDGGPDTLILGSKRDELERECAGVASFGSAVAVGTTSIPLSVVTADIDADRVWPSLDGGGDSDVTKQLLLLCSDTADVAKLSSSSFSSSKMSSGITRVGRSSGIGVAHGASSERNRRNDSGEMSRVRLPSDVTLTVSSVTNDAGVMGRLAMLRPRSPNMS